MFAIQFRIFSAWANGCWWKSDCERLVSEYLNSRQIRRLSGKVIKIPCLALLLKGKQILLGSTCELIWIIWLNKLDLNLSQIEIASSAILSRFPSLNYASNLNRRKIILFHFLRNLLNDSADSSPENVFKSSRVEAIMH